MNIRDILFFIVFAFVPGFLYQRIQDDWRPNYSGTSEMVSFLFGIAPNFLGAISLASGLFLIAKPFFSSICNARRGLYTSAVSLTGLLLWEIGQIWFPNGTFDINDVLWTFLGIVVAWLVARFWFRKDWGSIT